MSDDVSYRTVTSKLRWCGENAIRIDAAPGRPDTVSIPRSLIHGGDDLRIGQAGQGDTVTFRLADWKAEELGFA